MDPKFKESNQKIDQEKAEHYSKSIKLMAKAIIKKTPREILIKVLKEEKIIKRDWCEKGEKYKEHE